MAGEVFFIRLNRSDSLKRPPLDTSKTLNTNFFKACNHKHNQLINTVTYQVILISKRLNGLAEHPKVEVDDKSIEELNDVLEDAVGQLIFVALGQVLLEAILAQALLSGQVVKVGQQLRVLTVQHKLLHSVRLLTFLLKSLIGVLDST